jgi:hypothetical protein
MQSYANRVEISTPPSYVLKTWTNASSPELLKTVDLWRDDKPANAVSFAASSPGNGSFHLGEQTPATPCAIPTRGGVWQARLYALRNRQTGDSTFVVSARMSIPGDTSIIHFLGTSQTATERGRQVAMLRSFRLLSAIAPP